MLLPKYFIIRAYLLAFFILAVLLLVVLCSTVKNPDGDLEMNCSAPLVVMLIIGFVATGIWLKMMWNMASVVSVLKQTYGLGAVRKSMQFLRGKRLVTGVLAIVYNVLHLGTIFLVQCMVVDSTLVSLFASILISTFSGLQLMQTIMQSILYFVCMAHHDESVVKYALANHLDRYLGRSVPPKDPISLEAREP